MFNVASSKFQFEVWNFEFKESESQWFQIIEEHYKHGNFRKKETIILSLIWGEQELCAPSRSEYVRLIVSKLGLLSEYNYWLAEYSPIIQQKSITTII